MKDIKLPKPIELTFAIILVVFIIGLFVYNYFL